MNTECSHCGHAFETLDDLATCPKCDQVFEPSRGARIAPNETKATAAEWTGRALCIVGLAGAFFVNLFAGAIVAVLGIGLMKYSGSQK